MKKTTLSVNTEFVIWVYICGFTGVLGIIIILQHWGMKVRLQITINFENSSPQSLNLLRSHKATYFLGQWRPLCCIFPGFLWCVRSITSRYTHKHIFLTQVFLKKKWRLYSNLVNSRTKHYCIWGDDFSLCPFSWTYLWGKHKPDLKFCHGYFCFDMELLHQELPECEMMIFWLLQRFVLMHQALPSFLQ